MGITGEGGAMMNIEVGVLIVHFYPSLPVSIIATSYNLTWENGMKLGPMKLGLDSVDVLGPNSGEDRCRVCDE